MGGRTYKIACEGYIYSYVYESLRNEICLTKANVCINSVVECSNWSKGIVQTYKDIGVQRIILFHDLT